MNTFAGWPVGHPNAALSLLVLLGLVGVALAPWLPPERLPAVPGAALVVEARLPGIDAVNVERLIVLPLEEALSDVPGLQETVARASDGRAAIELRFASHDERERALDAVRSRIDELEPKLPAGMDPPSVERLDPPLRAVSVYAVTAAALSADVVKWADQTLRRPLHELAETASATLEGADTAEILIQPDPRRLATLGLSFDDVIQALQRADVAPTRRGARRIATTVPPSAEAIAARAVRLPGGEPIALAELAEVSVLRRPAAQHPRYEDRPALLVRVYPRSARDASAAAERGDAYLAWLRANGQVPPQITVHKLFDEADETKKWSRRVMKRIIVVTAVSLLVVLVFLGARDATVTLAAFAVWLPFCAAALWLAGVALNVMTVAGAMLACLTLVLLVARFAAAPLVAALILAATIMSWWDLARFGVSTHTTVAFAIAAAVAVPIAWLLSAWTRNSDEAVSLLVRQLPPRLRIRALIVPVMVVSLGVAILAAVRTLPVVVAEVTGGTAAIRVTGPDEVRLTTLVDNLVATLRALPGLSGISRLPVREESWRLRVDEARLLEEDIGIVEVGRAFAIARDGIVVGELVDADAQLPLRVQLAPGAAGAAFERLLLRGEHPDQRALYLRDIGSAERTSVWRERLRARRVPAAEVRARWSGAQAPVELTQLPRRLEFPAGYTMQVELTPDAAETLAAVP